MRILSLSELQAPDDLTLAFTPLGLGRMAAEPAAEYQQRLIAAAELVEQVGPETRQAFERLRSAYSYGVLCYELFTIVHDQAILVLELALSERFLAFYEGSIPVVVDGVCRPLTVRSMEQVREALSDRGGEYRRRGQLHLSNDECIADFTASLWQLRRWARGERLLHGQRNRHHEDLLRRMRNRAAHPVNDHRLAPIHAARTIWDLAEITNRLWGERTPGGQLYPAALDRAVYAIAWDRRGHEITSGHVETLDRPGWAPDHRYLLVRAAHFDNLQEYSTRYEATRYPCDYLWGPGSRDDAITWLHANAPGPDTVEDYLDRWFVIRHNEGARPEWPRRPATFLGLSDDERDGLWHLVQADYPEDAYTHRTHQDNTGEAGPGPCDSCHATAGPSGTWQELTEHLHEFGMHEAERLPELDLAEFRYRRA